MHNARRERHQLARRRTGQTLTAASRQPTRGISALDAHRPPLKWAGGKRWLVPHIRPAWAAFASHRLVEPFCGGLSIALGLQPESALLNDLNPHPVNVYRQLQRGFRTRLRMENDAALYYEHRQNFNDLIAQRGPNGRTQAAIFYYLNRTCFNGLCRFNRKGKFNVPFGQHRTINYVKDFTAYQAVLAPWKFSQLHFEELALTSTDFVYADPPYDVQFRQYDKHGFDWDEQAKLAQWLATHQGPVLLSNQATDKVQALYLENGYELRFLPAPRTISRDGNRDWAIEVLAIRNLDPGLIKTAFRTAAQAQASLKS